MGIKSFVAGVAVGAAVMAIYDGRVKLPTELKLPSISFTNPWAEPPLSDKWLNNPEAEFRACFAKATGVAKPLNMTVTRLRDGNIESVKYSDYLENVSFIPKLWDVHGNTSPSTTSLYFKANSTFKYLSIETKWNGASAEVVLSQMTGVVMGTLDSMINGTRINSRSANGTSPPTANRPYAQSMVDGILNCGANYMRAANSIAPQPN